MKLRFPLLPVIKSAAVLCFVFPMLPLSALLLLLAGAEANAALLWRNLAAVLLSGGIGMSCGAFLVPRLSRRPGRWSVPAANLLAFLISLGSGMVFFFCWMRFPAVSGGWQRVFLSACMGVLSFAAAFVCCRIWERGYDEILTNRYLTALVVLDLVCCIAFWLRGKPLALGAFSITMLAAACVYAAAKNQGNIDYLTEKRSSRSASLLPRRMRWYSFSLVCCTFVLIFAAYFLRNPIAWVFQQCLELLRRLVGALLRLIPQGKPGEPLPQETPPQQGGETGLPPAQGEPSIFWTIFGIILAGLFLLLLFYYRHEIWKGLCTAAAALRNFFHRVLFHQAAPPMMADVNQYFSDNVEELSRQPGSFRWRDRKYDLRRWKKEYRAFRAMEAGPGQMREGYRLAMMLLLLRKTALSPGDTPEEIRRKAVCMLPPDLLRSVTESYCRVRYDGEQPDSAALEALTRMLAQETR